MIEKDDSKPMNKYIKNSSKGFSLIEMIGVLAIIGILASVVAPTVFDAIRDGKITAAVSVLQTIKSSCTDYARKYNVFPRDGSKPPVTGYVRPYGPGGSNLSAGDTNIGDILISEGMLERLSLPIGPAGAAPYSNDAVKAEQVAGQQGTLSNSRLDYPVLVCQPYSSLSNQDRLFSGAQNTTRVIYMLVPGLTILEAAGLKTKIDGPFNETVSGPADLVTQATSAGGTGAMTEAVNRGNCRIVPSTVSPGTYDCFIYVAHD